jgi:hypothetical protein
MSKSVTMGHEDLFDLDGRIQNNKAKEVEAIILEVCAEERDNQWRRKVVQIDLRNLSQAEQDSESKKKADAYLKRKGIFLDAASVLCSAGAAFSGAPTGLFHVAAQAFDKTSGHERERKHSEIEGYSHRYQRIGSSIQEQTQQVQASDSGH